MQSNQTVLYVSAKRLFYLCGCCVSACRRRGQSWEAPLPLWPSRGSGPETRGWEGPAAPAERQLTAAEGRWQWGSESGGCVQTWGCWSPTGTGRQPSWMGDWSGRGPRPWPWLASGGTASASAQERSCGREWTEEEGRRTSCRGGAICRLCARSLGCSGWWRRTAPRIWGEEKWRIGEEERRETLGQESPTFSTSELPRGYSVIQMATTSLHSPGSMCYLPILFHRINFSDIFFEFFWKQIKKKKLWNEALRV